MERRCKMIKKLCTIIGAIVLIAIVLGILGLVKF